VKVLLVHNRYRSAQPSGENGVVDEEARLLEDAGCDVHRLELESDQIAGWSPLKRAGLPLRVIWSRRGQQLMTEAIDRSGAELVHVHNTFPLFSPTAFRAASRRKVTVINTLHNFRPLCPAGTFFRDGHVCEECLGRAPLPALRHGCYRDSRAATAPLVAMDTLHSVIGTWRQHVDAFITPSAFAMRKYVQAGWERSRFAVKYNTAEDLGLREGAGDPFVCIGRLYPEKGVDVLLRAWALAFPQGGPRLLIVGSGEVEAPLRQLAAGLRLNGVEFMGQLARSDALDVMRTARAVVVPSVWYEVFPRIVCEAYSLGVPVVASRIGSLTEVVQDEVTGLHFEAGSPESLADALRTLAASSELATRLGRAARAMYDAKLSPQATTARLLEIYSRAANGTLGGLPRQGVSPAPLHQVAG
jgi:glycosyltransferase involved in cell wall biosynthesis